MSGDEILHIGDGEYTLDCILSGCGLREDVHRTAEEANEQFQQMVNDFRQDVTSNEQERLMIMAAAVKYSSLTFLYAELATYNQKHSDYFDDTMDLSENLRSEKIKYNEYLGLGGDNLQNQRMCELRASIIILTANMVGNFLVLRMLRMRRLCVTMKIVETIKVLLARCAYGDEFTSMVEYRYRIGANLRARAKASMEPNREPLDDEVASRHETTAQLILAINERDMREDAVVEARKETRRFKYEEGFATNSWEINRRLLNGDLQNYKLAEEEHVVGIDDLQRDENCKCVVCGRLERMFIVHGGYSAADIEAIGVEDAEKELRESRPNFWIEDDLLGRMHTTPRTANDNYLRYDILMRHSRQKHT